MSNMVVKLEIGYHEKSKTSIYFYDIILIAPLNDMVRKASKSIVYFNFEIFSF